MGMSLEDHSSDYILEKWGKYIGVKPIPLDLPTVEMILSNRHRYSVFLVKWIERWHRRNEYDDVKEIINYILLLNTKFFPKDEHNKRWNVSDLVKSFSDTIGDPNLINKDSYNHLHALVIRKVDEWLDDKEIKRDYNLNAIIE